MSSSIKENSQPDNTGIRVFVFVFVFVQSNLGSRTPRIMNSSVYEQIFRTQSVSVDVLCLELRTRKPSTTWSDKVGESASAVFVGETETKTNHTGQLFSETEAEWVCSRVEWCQETEKKEKEPPSKQ